MSNDWRETTEENLAMSRASWVRRSTDCRNWTFLRSVVPRVATYMDECEECRGYGDEMAALAQDTSRMMYSPSESRKVAIRILGALVKHLRRQHRLISRGHHTGIGLSMGLAMGLTLNQTLEKGIGTLIGIVLGLTVGAALDARAKREGRVV